MKWRRHEPPPPAKPEDEETAVEATVSDETLRARRAAAEAAFQLARVRAQTPKIARSGEELEDLNRHNGFYLVVRRALGS